MAKIRFVVTDVDGVVADRMPILQATFIEMTLRRYGIPAEISAKHYYETAGIHLSVQLKMLLEKSGIVLALDESELFVEEFILLSRQVRPKLFPGVLETLSAVKNSKRSLLAISGSPTKELKDLFERYRLPYDFFIGSDVVLKGDRHIQMLADYLEISLEEFCQYAVYVGDGPEDMKLGRRNNILTLGIPNTVGIEALFQAGASAVVAEFRDLMRYLSYYD